MHATYHVASIDDHPNKLPASNSWSFTMQEDASQTLARQWEMLRAIRRWPQKVTVTELLSTLLDSGFHTSRRTIERDLQELSGRFALVVDDSSKPYGWSWMKDANFEFMPRLTASQSVALLLARTHMKSLLPQTMLKDLAPVFDVADRELALSGWKDWHKRTAIIPLALALLPPKIDAKVVSDVQHALARKCCLTGRYRSKGSDVSKEMKIHPLGLLVRGSIQYLVCTLFDYEDVRQLAVHRLSETKVATESRKEPPGFDFSAYVAEASNFHSRGKIRLVARFDAAAAEHLKETPLSRDQTLKVIKGGRVEIAATVDDDEPLRWWLLAFGSQVEVCKPAALRNALESDLKSSVEQYAQSRRRIR
jgi:predicted DNA-binding transcriptional regulator YafY